MIKSLNEYLIYKHSIYIYIYIYVLNNNILRGGLSVENDKFS